MVPRYFDIDTIWPSSDSDCVLSTGATVYEWNQELSCVQRRGKAEQYDRTGEKQGNRTNTVQLPSASR